MPMTSEHAHELRAESLRCLEDARAAGATAWAVSYALRLEDLDEIAARAEKREAKEHRSEESRPGGALPARA